MTYVVIMCYKHVLQQQFFFFLKKEPVKISSGTRYCPQDGTPGPTIIWAPLPTSLLTYELISRDPKLHQLEYVGHF